MGDFSQGLQGAGGGAMAGFGIGGPWGAAIGGGLGFLGGILGSGGQGDYQEQLKKLAAGYGSRTAPQRGPAHQAGGSALTGNRAGLISQLEAMARGEGPSAAAGQMRDAMDRAAGAQASAAAGAGGRGVNAGAALRNATNNTAAIMSQGARDTGIMRSNEQMGALGQLGGVIGQGIGQDNALSSFNAGQQNQGDSENLQAQLQTMGLNQSGQLQALMAAMQGAGPGMGTQLLAGGASAMPGLLQYRQQKSYMDMLKAQQSGHAKPNFGPDTTQSLGLSDDQENFSGSPYNPSQWNSSVQGGGFLSPELAKILGIG